MGEHWIVENKRWGNSGLRVVTDPDAAAQYRTWRGWEVTGPFVEKATADQLTGAVDALNTLVRLHALGRPNNPAWDDAWTAARAAIKDK